MYGVIIKIAFAVSLFANAVLFLPQAVKIIKLKSSQNVSVVTFVGFLAIQFVSVLYGVLINDWILALGFALGMVACSSVVVTATYYRINIELHEKK